LRRNKDWEGGRAQGLLKSNQVSSVFLMCLFDLLGVLVMKLLQVREEGEL
jgi:hypothetical protein